MHEAIREVFSKITFGLPVQAKRVLEVGATKADTLLTLPALTASEIRIGINADASQQLTGDVTIMSASGWQIPIADDYFDLVVCNATLEHDPKFWLTLSEMKRVLCGHLIIGVPGYTHSQVLGVHRFPGDYYRFGEDAIREVFFSDLRLIGLQIVLPQMPRFVAWGETIK